MYVEYDKVTGELRLKLPSDLKEYEKDLFDELYDLYAFEAMTPAIIQEMNQFVIDWFHKKNINLSK